MDEEANLDDESFRSDLERDSAHSSMNIEQRQDFQHFEGRVSELFFYPISLFQFVVFCINKFAELRYIFGHSH